MISKTEWAITHLGQPAMDILPHEVIIDKLRIGAADAIQFLRGSAR